MKVNESKEIKLFNVPTLSLAVERQYYRSSSCVEILTQSCAKDRLNKNALTPLANYSGKSARDETAETAKPWVDTCFVGKVQ